MNDPPESPSNIPWSPRADETGFHGENVFLEREDHIFSSGGQGASSLCADAPLSSRAREWENYASHRPARIESDVIIIFIANVVRRRKTLTPYCTLLVVLLQLAAEKGCVGHPCARATIICFT